MLTDVKAGRKATLKLLGSEPVSVKNMLQVLDGVKAKPLFALNPALTLDFDFLRKHVPALLNEKLLHEVTSVLPTPVAQRSYNEVRNVDEWNACCTTRVCVVVVA